MLLTRVIADVLAENCYVLAGDPGVAVVVDPGAGTAPQVASVLRERGLTLGAVLLTHGHPDHIWDAAAVAGKAPVYVPEPDAYRLTDPLNPASPLYGTLMEIMPQPYRAPNAVALSAEFFEGGGAELVPGVGVRAVPAPGHTEGSTVYLVGGSLDESARALAVEGLDAQVPDASAPLVLTGDVLFRGSVGRTDLPGGDDTVMHWSLRTLRQALDPASLLFPGHGPATTMSHERATNPFLQ